AGQHPLSRAGGPVVRRDLPGAHALGQGRRPVGRLRRRHRLGPLRRRLARGAQPQPVDRLLRRPLGHQLDHPDQGL
ncbi:MAG: hypothetical protein AVDCRST_MAG85-2561, partial [uncultured Solirubrobacteraceae bacterium]